MRLNNTSRLFMRFTYPPQKPPDNLFDLLNIALNGMEELLSQFKKVKEYRYFDKKKGKQCIHLKKSNKFGFIRYADDFLITATKKEDIEAIKPIIQDWLKQRGLELNPDKTKIAPIQI